MAWFQTHERQKLNFRYQVGPGFTIVALKEQRHVTKLSFTGTYERNQYRTSGLEYIADKTIREYSAFRITGRVFGSWGFSQNVVSAYYEMLFQQAVDNKDNWRIFAESGIYTKITKGFSMRTYIIFEYQQVHVDTEKPNDLIFNLGLNYSAMAKRNQKIPN